MNQLSLNKLAVTSLYKKEKTDITVCKVRNDGALACFGTSNGYLKLLSLQHKSLLKSFNDFSEPINSLDLLPKRPLVACGGYSGGLVVRDFASELESYVNRALHSDTIRRILFVPWNNECMATCSLDRKILLVDLRLQQSGCVTL